MSPTQHISKAIGIKIGDAYSQVAALSPSNGEILLHQAPRTDHADSLAAILAGLRNEAEANLNRLGFKSTVWSADRTVLAIPTKFDRRQIEKASGADKEQCLKFVQNLQQAAEEAKLTLLELLPESVASVRYFCWREQITQGNFLYYRLDGRGFEATVIGFAQGKSEIWATAHHEDLTGENIDQTMAICEETLKEALAGSKGGITCIDQIILAGDAMQLPCAQEKFKNTFCRDGVQQIIAMKCKEPVCIDAETIGTQGAALYAAELGGLVITPPGSDFKIRLTDLPVTPDEEITITGRIEACGDEPGALQDWQIELSLADIPFRSRQSLAGDQSFNFSSIPLRASTKNGLVFKIYKPSGAVGAEAWHFIKHNGNAIALDFFQPRLLPVSQESAYIKRKFPTEFLKSASKIGEYQIEEELNRSEREEGDRHRVFVEKNRDEVLIFPIIQPLLGEDREKFETIRAVWKLLCEDHHPNILQLKKVIAGSPLSFFVAEHMTGGNLETMLQDAAVPKDVFSLTRIIAQTVAGIQNIHGKGIIHGNLNLHTILSSPNFEIIKIGSFGKSLLLTPKQRSDGTAGKLFEQDMQSFGALIKAVVKGHGYELDSSDLPDWIRQLIDRFGNADPAKRFLKIIEIFEHVEFYAHPERKHKIDITALRKTPLGIDYIFTKGGEQSSHPLDINVADQTLRSLKANWDKLGKLAFKRVEWLAKNRGVEKVDEQIRKRLEKISGEGARLIFPAKLRETFEKKESTFLSLYYDSHLDAIPWEILKVNNSHLCRRFPVARMPRIEKSESQEVRAGKLKVLILADPCGDLEMARKEGSRLKDEFEKSPLKAHLEIKLINNRHHRDDLDLFRDIRQADVIHFAGHVFHTEPPCNSGWLIKGKVKEQPPSNQVIDMKELRQQWENRAPLLVFANGCASGYASARSIARYAEKSINLAHEFLAMGVGVYVGTAWETPDVDSTVDFASVFYKNLFAGATISHAVLAARNFCAKEHGEEDLTWARYLLFGDPLFQLTKNFQFKKSDNP